MIHAQDTIFWNKDIKLTWNDFRGEPNPEARYLAMTSSGIKYSYKAGDSATWFTATAFFNPSRSWKKNIESKAILNHEQGHFDITEIYARKLHAAVANLKTDKRSAGKLINELAEKMIVEKNDMQKRYDQETVYGLDAASQQRWDAAIAEQLNGG